MRLIHHLRDHEFDSTGADEITAIGSFFRVAVNYSAASRKETNSLLTSPN